MAQSTYLQLVNDLLVEVNEVELSETQFASATGVQKHAKNAINNSLREIEADQYYWPFNLEEGTITAVPYQEVYAFPSDAKIIDFDSFQIQKDATLGVNHQTLKEMDFEEWLLKFRDQENDKSFDQSGGTVPTHVIRGPGRNIRLYPTPDKSYTIKYDYYLRPISLSDKDDTCKIPEEFEHVIISGGMVWFNLFLDNEAQSDYVNKTKFKPQLKQMRSLLINDDIYVFDRRLRY